MTKDEALEIVAALEAVLDDCIVHEFGFPVLAECPVISVETMHAVEDARDKLRTALSEPDWTRIEDMPEEWKDGRELLGYREDCGQFLMKWTDADEFIPEGKEEEHGCDGEWEFECDWFIPDTGYRISNDGDPTHVRELPPPPKGKQP